MVAPLYNELYIYMENSNAPSNRARLRVALVVLRTV